MVQEYLHLKDTQVWTQAVVVWLRRELRKNRNEGRRGGGTKSVWWSSKMWCFGGELRMRPLFCARRLWVVLLGGLLAAGAAAAQDRNPNSKKLPAPAAEAPKANHRLILKDGSYQIVRQYEVVGDRVRYISVERSGEWEELPNDLVDWEATKKWERDHAVTQQANEDPSEAMKEAETIDKEEATEREEENARMPTVAKGLELPDEDSVFVLDAFEGTPELVELAPNDMAVDAKTHHGLSTLNPMAGARAAMELPGAHAKVHLHVNEPEIYLSLNLTDDKEHVLSHAVTVETSSAKDAVNRKHGAHSAQSGFAIVKVDERRAVRIVGSLKLARDGTVTQEEDVIPAKVEVMPGKHWLKLTPAKTLVIGEYALVEILSPQDISPTVWDFRVDPQLGDNPGSIGPVQKQ